MTIQAQVTKEKIVKNKLDLIKSKTFCVSKDAIKKGKRQTTGWAKILTNYITDKGLISRIYKEHIQLDIKTTQFKNGHRCLPWRRSG